MQLTNDCYVFDLRLSTREAKCHVSSRRVAPFIGWQRGLNYMTPVMYSSGHVDVSTTSVRVWTWLQVNPSVSTEKLSCHYNARSNLHIDHGRLVGTLTRGGCVSICYQRNTIPYDGLRLRASKSWRIASLICCAHGTKQERVMKKLKIKKRDAQKKRSSKKSPWSQSWDRKGVYGGKDLWKR